MGRATLIHSIVFSAYSGGNTDTGVAYGVARSESVTRWWSSISGVWTQQTGVAGNRQLIGGVNGNGFIVQSPQKFGMISYNIAQARNAADASPAYTVEYWNGSTWTTITPLGPGSTSALGLGSTGTRGMAFNTPLDWLVGAGSLGPDESLYSLRVTATGLTTAPILVTSGTDLIVGRTIAMQRVHTSNTYPLFSFFTKKQLLLRQGEYILGYIGSAGAADTFHITYQTSP